MYVISDGFDLGIGILFLLAPSEADRDVMMNSVAPIWDGNETWLVFGGTVLIGAFPVAYATILPALYLPLVLMLFGLIFRGVAFEYRFRADAGATGVGLGVQRRLDPGARSPKAWRWAAISTASRCKDGVFAGEHPWVSQRLRGRDRSRAGCRLRLLGATWLVFKTEGATQALRAQNGVAEPGSLARLPARDQHLDAARPSPVMQRWFSAPQIYYLWLPPALALVAAFGIWRRLDRAPDVLPVPAFDRAVPAGPARSRHHAVALCRALFGDVLAGGLVDRDARIPRRRHGDHRADHPRLSRLRPSGVPRQDPRRHRLRGLGYRHFCWAMRHGSGRGLPTDETFPAGPTQRAGRALAAAIAPFVRAGAVAEIAAVGLVADQLHQQARRQDRWRAARSRPCRATSAACGSQSDDPCRATGLPAAPSACRRGNRDSPNNRSRTCRRRDGGCRAGSRSPPPA